MSIPLTHPQNVFKKREKVNMTDDLVKELRASYDPNDAVPTQVCLDAADRIEKLEAALRLMLSKCAWEKRGQWCGSLDCHCRIARKALEGKDD